MYLNYWNLNEAPFQNTPSRKFAYYSEQHREGLARLVYLVQNRKLGGVMAGPYGSGKSMILELLDREVHEKTEALFIKVDASLGGPLPLARQILRRMGSHTNVDDISEALQILEDLCAHDRANFSHVALAVDEAQFLRNPETIEFLHLLTNVRSLNKDGSYGENAVTLILSGHIEVVKFVLNDLSLRQRLQLIWKLSPLTLQQTMEYVQFRIRTAGGDIWMFGEDVFPALHDATKGLPRVINNICDLALVLGCAAQASSISLELMRQAVDELDFGQENRGED
jgi:type II secretory pathway predicted ATPase ExeA